MRFTQRQADVLVTIQVFAKEHGYSPTVRELADRVGLKSSSTVHGLLERLQKHGLIEWEPSRPRTIRIIKNGV